MPRDCMSSSKPLALMAVFGVSIKMPTMILPSFILAVGVGDKALFHNIGDNDRLFSEIRYSF